MTFEQFIDAIRSLRLDRSGGVPKPYKPLLLASIVVLIHKGEIRSRDVFLDGGLKSVFYQLLAKLYPGRFQTANIVYPFRYLDSDRVLRLVPKDGAAASLQAARAVGGAEWKVMKHVRCADLDTEVFQALASSFQNRFRTLQVLIQTYDFPRDRTGLLWDLLSTDEAGPKVPVAAEPSAITERAVEEHLETNWDTTEFARLGIELSRMEKHGLPCRQVLTPRNTIDLLGYRAKAREWWVFELKKGRTSDAVVGQVGRYMGWITQHHARPNQSVRGAIIVGRSDENLKSAVLSNDRLSLWQYDHQLSVHQISLSNR